MELRWNFAVSMSYGNNERINKFSKLIIQKVMDTFFSGHNNSLIRLVIETNLEV